MDIVGVEVLCAVEVQSNGTVCRIVVEMQAVGCNYGTACIRLGDGHMIDLITVQNVVGGNSRLIRLGQLLLGTHVYALELLTCLPLVGVAIEAEQVADLVVVQQRLTVISYRRYTSPCRRCRFIATA